MKDDAKVGRLNEQVREVGLDDTAAVLAGHFDPGVLALAAVKAARSKGLADLQIAAMMKAAVYGQPDEEQPVEQDAPPIGNPFPPSPG